MKNLEFSMKELRLSLSLSFSLVWLTFVPLSLLLRPVSCRLSLPSPLRLLHGCTGLFSQSPLFPLSSLVVEGRVGSEAADSYEQIRILL